jgi:hypothetical protein
MRWAGHVTRTDARRDSWRVGWGNMKEREKLGDPGADRKIMLQ